MKTAVHHARTALARLTASAVAVSGLWAGVAAAEEVTLYSWREQEIPLWEHISENALIDGVTVNFVRVPGDDYDTKLRIDLQSDGPDLFQGRAGAAWLAPFIDAGVIEPLGDDVGLERISPAAMAAARGADGQTYGVPFAIQMQSILFNEGVLAANGIEPPTSMDELAAAAGTLAEAGVTPFAFGGRSGWWLNQVVGETMTAGMVGDETAAKLIEGEACFTDDEYVATLATVKDWNERGWLGANPMADDYGAMRTAVALGEAAMMIDGIWSVGPASPVYEIDPELRLGFAPVPGDVGKVYVFGDGSYLANAKSSRAAAVEKVLAFTTTAEFAELFARHVGELPAFGGDYAIEEPRLAEVAAMIRDDGYASTPFFAYALNAGEPSFGQLVADGYQALLAGDASAEAVAQGIQDGLNSWDYVGKDRCS